MAYELDQVFVVYEDPATAEQAGHQKQEAARAAGDERGRALGLIKVADAQIQMGRTDEASYYAQEALGVCGEIKFEEGKAAAMNVMTKVLTKKGRDEEELEEALDSGMDSLKLFRKLSYRKGEACALASVSAVYAAMGRSPQAVKQAKEALTIFAELGDTMGMAQMYIAIKDGFLAKQPADTFKAEKSMLKALEIYNKAGNKSKEAAANHTLAKVAVAAEDFKKASGYLATARELYAGAGDFQGQAAVIATLQGLYLQAGMYSEALVAGQKQCELFQEAGDMSAQAKAMIRLAETMLDNEDHESALKVATDAMNVCVPIGDYDGMQAAKTCMDAANKSKKIEEINIALLAASEWTNIPTSLIVDPGLGARVAGDFATAVR